MSNIVEYMMLAALGSGVVVMAAPVGQAVSANFCAVSNAISGSAKPCTPPTPTQPVRTNAPVKTVSAAPTSKTFSGSITGTEMTGSGTQPITGTVSFSLSGNSVNETISNLASNGVPLDQVAPGIYPTSITYTGSAAKQAFDAFASPPDGSCGNLRCASFGTVSGNTVSGRFGASFTTPGAGPFDVVQGTFSANH